MKTSAQSDQPLADIWTIASIAVVAYCLANVLHEGLGHGGACILVGGKPRTLNAIFFDYDHTTVSITKQKIISAGGSIVNVISGGVAFAILRFRKVHADSLRYFLWLFSIINFLTAFGYLVFSGLAGVGDWAKVIAGIEPQLLLRLGIAGVGAALYFVATPKLLMPEFRLFLSGDAPYEMQIRRLTLLPYLVGGTTFVAAGLLNPYGFKLVLISAMAASLGGTSLLAWYPRVALKDAPPMNATHPLIIKRSVGWLIAAAITLAIFVGALGRGINF